MTSQTQKSTKGLAVQFLVPRSALGDRLARCEAAGCNGWRIAPSIEAAVLVPILEAAGVGTWEVAFAMSEDRRFVWVTVIGTVPAGDVDDVRRRLLHGGLVVMDLDADAPLKTGFPTWRITDRVSGPIAREIVRGITSQ